MVDQISLVLGLPLACILLTACASDLKARKIPNIVTLGGVLLGIALHSILAGWSGMGLALAGAATGFCLLLLPYLAGALGAGDVKLMAAVGSILGPELAFWAALFTFVAGGMMAAMVALWYQQLGTTLKRLYQSALVFIGTRVWTEPAQVDPVMQKLRLPYALAIAVGTGVAWWVGV